MSDGKVRWSVRLGLVVFRVLASTWRIRFNERAPMEDARRRTRIILTLWHGELLPLLWVHRNQQIAIMISEHRDGEIVARIAESLGNRTVRGSSSKGGSRALIALVRELADGHDAAITPDGPRGPARVLAPGVAVAAYRSGAVIVPIRAAASRAWRLKSWDRFMIPMPFARIDVSYGTPTAVVADSARAAAEMAPQLEALMHATPGSEP